MMQSFVPITFFHNLNFFFSSLHGLAKTLHEGHIISRDKLYVLLKHRVLGPESTNIVLFLQDAVSMALLMYVR